MNGWPAELLAVALLATALTVAARRPEGFAAGGVAVAGAAVLVGTNTVPWPAARSTLHSLAPTAGFLAAILVLGQLAADAGVFGYLGALAGRASMGQPRSLLILTIALAASVTAVLTLDATVVLLSPVVLATARALRTAPRPHLYACIQLANAGSLLLPVSNLTNLLAFHASGLTFGRFSALMALPWLGMVTLQWIALRTVFRADLPAVSHPTPPLPVAPRYALGVLGLTVVGFVVTSVDQIAPVWAATAGAIALAGPALARRRTSVRHLLGAASIGFCAFVLGLGIVVDAVTRHGVGDVLRDLLPDGTSWLALLGIAALAALLANLVNNLPATLALVPMTAAQPLAVLAVLVGVNVGPNATYFGSLATLLWRRVLPAGERPHARTFHVYGAVTVPIAIVIATTLLWCSARLIGS